MVTWGWFLGGVDRDAIQLKGKKIGRLMKWGGGWDDMHEEGTEKDRRHGRELLIRCSGGNKSQSYPTVKDLAAGQW